MQQHLTCTSLKKRKNLLNVLQQQHNGTFSVAPGLCTFGVVHGFETPYFSIYKRHLHFKSMYHSICLFQCRFYSNFTEDLLLLLLILLLFLLFIISSSIGINIFTLQNSYPIDSMLNEM